MFEKASRMQIRFDTSLGLLGTEDLWRLPLTSRIPSRASLDDIARGLHRQLKSEDDRSFVDEEKQPNEELQLKFDVVRHIIAVRKTEKKAEEIKQANAELKQKLLRIKAERDDATLLTKSDQELDELISKL